jgi:hypothetical protein
MRAPLAVLRFQRDRRGLRLVYHLLVRLAKGAT